MATSRAQILKELLPGLNGLFGLTYDTLPTEYSAIYNTENSERSFEEEQKLSGLGMAPTKDEGSAITYDGGQEHFTARYNHETIAMGFSITEEAMEDNLYESMSSRYTKSLAHGMHYTKEVKGAALLNDGFTTYQSGDGVTLFSTAHPLVYGGTNSNRPAVAADLNETSLEAAYIQIEGWTDERGLLIQVRPKGLVIPPDLQFTAHRVLQSNLRPGTADNDANALKDKGSYSGVDVNHFLTDTNAWFVCTTCPDGLKMFQRVALSTGMDGDFDTGNVRYKARERYSFGVSDPLGIYGSPGA